MPHDDFLAAIRAAPADPHARLVYADWLEERGDPRSEYLRTEHELARTSPFVARYWDIKQRRDELRRGCEPDWLEGVGYPTYYTPLFTTVPEDRDECWRRVDRFVDFWHATPLDRTSGNTEEEIRAAEDRLRTPLPAALREWYRLAGRRTEIWSGQFVMLNELEEIEFYRKWDALLFRGEIGGYECWGVRRTDMGNPDPAIRCFVEPAIESERTTGFAIQQLLVEATFVAPFVGYSRDVRSCTDVIPVHFRAVNGSRLHYGSPIDLYEGHDVLIRVFGYSIYVAARRELPSVLPARLAEQLAPWS